MATEGIATRLFRRWKQHLCCLLMLSSACSLGVPSLDAAESGLDSPSHSAELPAPRNQNVATSVADVAPSSSLDASFNQSQSAHGNASVNTRSGSPGGPSSAIEDALQRRASITFRKTSLQEVVFLLSDLWQVSIVAGEKVTGEVSGVFSDAPLRDVLSAILTSSGYGYTAAGNSLIILPIEEVGTASPEFRSRTLPLMIANDQQRTSTLEAAKMLLSDRGKIQAFGNGQVLVIDTPDRIAQVEKMFADLQVREPAPGGAAASLASPAPLGNVGWSKTRIAYFTPQYTEAAEMGVSLSAALGNGNAVSTNASTSAVDPPIVAVYEEENRIMVRGTAEQLSLAAEAFQQLDVPRAQVRISALIYDVTLEELESLGVQWGRGNLGGQAVAKSLEFASLVPTGAIAETGLSTLTMSSISNDFNASLIVEALDSSAEAKLLANPSITVGDRRDATIKIVTQIPYRTAETPDQSSSDDGTSVITQQIPTVEFKEAGITLVVRPRISNDGVIEMVVKPRHSTQTGTVNFLPIIDEREAETTVRVANGQTFMMGGLRQKKVVENVFGIPYLKDMRFVGKLFQSHNTSVVESELIVFLKPEIVSPCYTGLARERQAARIAMHELDRIPYASHCPQTPYCNDLNCPNHHPRVRINGGSDELEMLGGFGITPFMMTYPDEQSAYISGSQSAYVSGTAMTPNLVNDAEVNAPDSVIRSNATGGYPEVHVAPYHLIPAPTPLAQ
ncbi:type II secretion system protein GspD [Aporhodopirellula aestuarii]|uniref:Type II secretion system protein GspD n=1 Tax=Aporhodopirellula aestuarii TaxID=2950107 RepID=A0ABT0U5L8_9BACT|nr:secretin N-terminal domain-containing protein [Aporhodopirellula aestuarii]MCM2371723.1 type II secretion system protein GspD [Aporhodopirellula aestuarii]